MEYITDTIIQFLTYYGLSVLGAIAILIVGRIIAGIARNLAKRALGKGEVDPDLTSFVSTLIYYLVIVFAVVAALAKFGIQTASMVAVLGAVGFAIGFALQGSLSNFASGVMLLLFRPFLTGHLVNIAGVSGTVREIGLFSTTLSTPDNVQILVPNGKIYGDTIQNYSAYDTRRVDLVIGIGYDSPIDKARKIMADLIKADDRILSDPSHQIAVSELADSSVNFVVRVWVNSPDYWAVKFDLTEQIKLAFDENHIEIPFPQRVIHQA